MRLRIQSSYFLYFFILFLGLSGFFLAVVWPTAEGFYTFVSVAALGGFGVSAYIYYTKKSNNQLVCPSGSDCNAVVNSRYSKFLGIHLEYIGMLYFLVIFASYLALIFTPHLLNPVVIFGIVALSMSAALFSFYLLFVQAFLLKQWCIWCLLATSLSMAIFFISLVSVDLFVGFIASIENILIMFEFLGFSLGIGSATAAIFLFFRFLRDLNINNEEMAALKGISEIVWIGLAFVLMSQFALYVSDPTYLAHSSTFLIEMVSMFVAAFSGAILIIILAPFIPSIPFAKRENEQDHSLLVSIRKPIFIVGAISISSWYFAFFSNFLPNDSLPNMISLYMAVVLISIGVSLMWENKLQKSAKNLEN